MNTNKLTRFVITVVAASFSIFGSSAPALGATVTYTMQTGNFNTLNTERNNNPPYAGTYNNGSTELAQYANGGSFGNTPGAAAFQTFTTTGNGQTGTTRALQVGDTFTITAFTSANPSAGGYLGISFRDSTTYSSFSSATDSATEARFQLDNTGGWKVYNGGTAVDSGLGSNADRTFTIKITSANTFNATVGSTTYYDLSMAASGGTIDSFAIYTFGDSNQNSFWKSASLSDTGTVEFGNGAGNGVTRTVSGVIANGLAANSTSSTVNNAVTVSGDVGSQVNFTAANTYSGLTTINNNATLEAQNADALGSTAAGTTVNSGGTLKLWSSSTLTTTAEALTLNGSGVSSGGALRNAGGNNTYAGAITLGSATRINSDSGTLTLDVSSGNAISGTQNLTIGGSGNVTVGDNINISSAKLVKDGAGVLTLGAAMGYTGNTEIDAGTLSINSSGDLNDGSMVYLGSGTAGQNATLQLAGTTAFGNALQINEGAGSRTISKADATSQTMSGNITNNDSTTISVSQSGGNLTLSGVLAGTNTIAKSGLGTLTLSGSSANTMNAATTISAGTVILNKSANTAAVASQVTVDSGATLRTDAVNQLNNQLVVNNGTLDFNGNGQSLALGGAGTVTLGAATITNNNSGPDTFSGRITGAGGLVKAGVGNFTLSGNSDYSGATTVNAGTLTISGGQSSSGYTLSGGNLTTSGSANLGNSVSVDVSSSASTFTVGASDTIGSIAGTAGTINITNSGILTLGANTTSSFSGVIAGNGALVKGGLGTLTFDGSSANTYSGNTTVNAGTLILSKSGGANALAGTPTINSGGIIRLGAANQFAGDATFLTVNSGGEFDMNGFNETLAIQGAGTVSLGSGTMTINPSMSDAFSGVIAGSGAVIKTNTGTQILSGNSTYSGATTVGQGVLLAASANALGATSGATTVSAGAALQLSNGITTGENIALNGTGVGGLDGALRNVSGANTVSGTLTLGSNARIGASGGSLSVGAVSGGSNVLYVGGAGNSAITGVLSGSGNTQDGTTTSLFKDGAATLTLSGNNTYTGDTRITAGNVTVASGGSLGNGSDVFISSGASLTVNTNTTVASIRETGNTNGGTAAIGSGATLTINGANRGTLLQNSISGAGNLAVNASGDTSLSLYGTQSYTGTTTVSGGKLSTGVALASSGVTVNGGTFETSAANVLGSSASVAISSGTYSLGGNDTVGSFSISGGTLGGSGTLTASTYGLNGGNISAVLGAGAITVGGGTNTLGSAGRLNSGASLTVNSGKLSLGGNETVSSLAGSGGEVDLGNGNLTLGGNSYSNSFAGVISGSGSLIKNGTGTLYLSGMNTYAGGTFLNNGYLDSESSSAFGTGSITVASLGTLNLESHNVTNHIVNNGGTILSSGTVSDVVASNGTTSIGGSGSVVVEASGSATVDVSGSNVTVSNVSGTAAVNIGGTDATVDTVSGGTVTLSNTATGSRVNTASAGTVNANASGTTLGTVSGSAAVNVGGANARVGTLSGGSVAANAAGLVVTNFNGGNIDVASRVTVGLQSGSSSGVISGQGGIAKQGASTLTLSGANTYSGATTVEEGKLVVNGSVASSAVTVQSGAILGGSGTVGSLTLNGILAPGNSAGTTTSVGNTFWNQGSSYDWEIFNLAGPAGTGWDLLSVTGGTLDLTGITGPGGFTINLITLQGDNNTQGALTGFNPATNYATGWMIASASSISGFNASEFNINKNLFVSGSGTFAIEQRAISGGQGLFVTYTGGGSEPIPEPGTWAAAALLAGAAGYVRWRRRKEQTKDA